MELENTDYSRRLILLSAETMHEMGQYLSKTFHFLK